MRQREFLQLHCRLGCGFAGLFVGLAIIPKRWFGAQLAWERMLAADFAQRVGAQPARGRRGIHASFVDVDGPGPKRSPRGRKAGVGRL